MAQIDPKNELDELDALKKSLELSVEESDTENLEKLVEQFSNQFKNMLESKEYDELQGMLNELKKNQKPGATYYEYVLFFVVLGFLISVFGN